MKNSLKAALLSALVLPGAGQIVLKRYLSGVLFALVSIIALSVIVAKIIKFSSLIVAKINNGALDQGGGLIGILSNSMVEVNTGVMNTTFLIYFGVWILSILDAYRVGDLVDKKQDRQKASSFNFS
jgi:TM2 domain-containing membrane protein YozV